MKFTFLNNYFQQTDGYATNDPVAVTFTAIYFVKLENKVLVPLKPKF